MTTDATQSAPTHVEPSGRRRRRAQPWSGRKRRYDLVKEFVIALLVVGALTIGLALIFSSPDDKAVTLQRWATQNPSDFVLTAVTELDGTSTSAGYGPPYNHASDGQSIFFLHLQKWAGVRIPVNPPVDFVLHPLSTITGNPVVTAALTQYQGASADQQQKWASNYDKAISNAPNSDFTKVGPGDYGPVPAMTTGLLHFAQSGGLDSQSVIPGTSFYEENYTKPLLFLADSGYLSDLGAAQHLGGDQWGMMNETGNYPGQAWLWLYTMWYQISPFKTSGNADALVWAIMMILSLALILVPFIPGIRSIPRLIPIYRLVWRDYYKDHPLPRRHAVAQK
jgi:hypothetical protein